MGGRSCSCIFGGQKQWQQRFSYDSLGRLAAAGEHYGGALEHRSYLLNYDYDVYGNRYQKQSRNQGNQVAQVWVEGGSYTATTNRFASGLTYDDAGNVAEDGRFRQRRYEYDANNRQRRSSHLDGSNPVRSVYDGAGQRVATVAGGQVTRVMVYDAGGDLVAEYGGAASANGTQYVMSDQQGSTRLTMASAPVNNQLVVGRQDYLPFGEEVPGAVGPRAAVAGYDQSTNPRQKYAGMEQDDATGMSHTLWREYDSSSARWTAPDPYGGSLEPLSPQSFNRYAYVNNDPVNKVDPTGLMLHDIGVVQVENAAQVTRLNWASVTVLRRYMQGQTGEAQRQQRQQQRNAAFVRGNSTNTGGRFANHFGGGSGGANTPVYVTGVNEVQDDQEFDDQVYLLARYIYAEASFDANEMVAIGQVFLNNLNIQYRGTSLEEILANHSIADDPHTYTDPKTKKRYTLPTSPQFAAAARDKIATMSDSQQWKMATALSAAKSLLMNNAAYGSSRTLLVAPDVLWFGAGFKTPTDIKYGATKFYNFYPADPKLKGADLIRQFNERKR